MSNQSKKETQLINPNSLPNTHVKLLAFDFNFLTQPHPLSSSSDPTFFYRKGVPISRVEVFGVVVTRDFKPDKFLRFSIDDGTGCIQCILWCNQFTSSYFSRRSPSDVRSIAQMTNVYSDRVQVGFNVRVRGRVSAFRGLVQITVDNVVVENDPNYQILHWLDCINLSRRCYDVLSSRKGGKNF